MRSISLHIKSLDILRSDYLDKFDCAISRALDRAGYPHLRHEGTDIAHTETRETIIDSRNKSFQELTQLVWDMYDTKNENNFDTIKSFHFTLRY
jgi:hypothetical protein